MSSTPHDFDEEDYETVAVEQALKNVRLDNESEEKAQNTTEVVPEPLGDPEKPMTEETNEALNEATDPEPDLVEALIGHNDRLNALFAKMKRNSEAASVCLYHAKIHVTTSILLAIAALKPDQDSIDPEHQEFADELKAMEDTLYAVQKHKGSDLYKAACAMDELVKCKLLAASATDQ
jgi:hypothetical protein